MPSVWFVIPAWGRVALSAVCFQELRWALDHLPGADGYAVVIADDGNIDIARKLGFHTVTQASSPLGRKYNDGFQFAANCGADYVVPVGSDNWILPRTVFTELPANDEIFTSRQHAMVDETGTRLARLSVMDQFNRYGAGPFVIPAELLKACGDRPATDEAENGIDASTISNLTGANPGARLTFREIDHLAWVGFKSHLNLHSFDQFEHLWESVGPEPFWQLESLYPENVVLAAEEFYRCESR